MDTFLNNLALGQTVEGGGFRPIARYYPPMDFLLYLKEDCSYRADRVDNFLTLLWHPYKDDIVGIKLKGIRVIYEKNKGRLNPGGITSWPIFALLAEILLDVLAEPLITRLELGQQERLREKYRRAIQFAATENAEVSAEELKRAA